MDIGRFDVKAAASKGADLQLKNPLTGEPLVCADGTPFAVRMLGKDAPAVVAAAKDANARRVKGEIDELEAGVLVLASAIMGWPDEMALGGKPLPYSRENAEALLRDERVSWIPEQLNPFFMSRRNFSQNVPAD